MDDWLTQSAEMGDIYADGYFNIPAAAATNSSENLFSGQHQFVWQQTECECAGLLYKPLAAHTINFRSDGHESTAEIHVLPSHSVTHSCVLGTCSIGKKTVSPLFYRARVFQERMLSPRVVYFSKSELFWRYRHTMHFECGDMDNISMNLTQIERLHVAARRQEDGSGPPAT